MRLSRYLVVEQHPSAEDLVFMARVAVDAATGVHPGLPSQMVDSVRESAALYIKDGYVTDYLFIGLIAVQARPGGEAEPTVRLRQDPERMFFDSIYGAVA